jgi:hypothetical protein
MLQSDFALAVWLRPNVLASQAQRLYLRYRSIELPHFSASPAMLS